MRRLHRGTTLLTAAGLVSIALAVAVDWTAIAQTSAGSQPDDPVARLARRIERGETSLEFRPDSGYLRSLLDRLDIHVDSQLLVFSKTSFQQLLISPQTPRAIFFNDSVAVGSVQHGDVLEMVALDPVAGLNFYTLSVGESATPHFQRRGVECAFCHAPGNGGIPGFVVTSVVPSADGTPFFNGTFFKPTDHRTPFEDRWGGWYVTGTHGSQKHLGNAVALDPERPTDLNQTGTQNVTSLAGRFDASNFLSPTSDIVALMTLEHQVGMSNFMMRLTFQYARAQRSGMSDGTVRSLSDAIDDIVAYMLFVDEAPLREPVAGVSTFTATFPARGPRDHLGRSLRDFDLRTRLFRYPLTYLIYSEAFDRLPPGLQTRIYERLHAVLVGNDTRGRFASLSADNRRAVLEILLDTKPNLPDSWREKVAEP
jgi:hypothetical protein